MEIGDQVNYLIAFFIFSLLFAGILCVKGHKYQLRFLWNWAFLCILPGAAFVFPLLGYINFADERSIDTGFWVVVAVGFFVNAAIGSVFNTKKSTILFGILYTMAQIMLASQLWAVAILTFTMGYFTIYASILVGIAIAPFLGKNLFQLQTYYKQKIQKE